MGKIAESRARVHANCSNYGAGQVQDSPCRIMGIAAILSDVAPGSYKTLVLYVPAGAWSSVDRHEAVWT